MGEIVAAQRSKRKSDRFRQALLRLLSSTLVEVDAVVSPPCPSVIALLLKDRLAQRSSPARTPGN
jgi:hypothetical protein